MASPLWHLTLARFREFYREPAALFWVYGFPLILAFILGLAFREHPVPASTVDVQLDPHHPELSERLMQALDSDPNLKVAIHDEAACRQRLRTSKSDLILVPRPDNPAGVEFQYDATRSESVLARNAADRALLRAANPKHLLFRKWPSRSRAGATSTSSYQDCLASTCLAVDCLELVSYRRICVSGSCSSDSRRHP